MQSSSFPSLEYPQKKCPSALKTIAREISDNYHPVSYHRGGLLLAGDNLTWLHILAKNFLGRIDLVYIDPPFNTDNDFLYSNERTSHISYKNGDELAYSDSMLFNEYIEYIRQRIYAIHPLLSSKGTLYFHIDSKVGHYIKIILDEVFGPINFINDISRIKSNPKNFNRKAFGNQKDVIYIYSKSPQKNIFNNVADPIDHSELEKHFSHTDKNGRRYTTVPCHAPGETRNGATGGEWRGILPPPGRHWRCAPEKLEKLDEQGLIEWSENGVPRIKKFADEHKGKKIQDVWTSFKDPPYPCYPTEKNREMLEMIIRQSSDKDSCLLDAFCGSGTFLAAGLALGRRVIGIDRSEIAIKVALQREELRQAQVIGLDAMRREPTPSESPSPQTSISGA